MIKALIFLLISININIMGQTKTYQNKISFEKLEGKWYIHQTNFPMWLKGDKKNPTLNYSITTIKNKKVLFDEVIYIKNAKQKSIKGYDFALNKNNTSFKWKGKGLLSMLSSKWKIIYYNKEENWAIIKFEKTLFTPKGYDVISKNKNLSRILLEKINSKTKELEIYKLMTDIEQ